MQSTFTSGSWLFWGDALLAITFTVLILRRGKTATQIFVLGALIGLTWELPFYFMGPEFRAEPLYQLLAPLPYPAWLVPVFHSLWDGALFYVGVWLAGKAVSTDRPGPWLLVFMAFGAVSAVIIEIAGAGGLWHYVPSPWNQQLFLWMGNPVTLLPILIWLVAPLVFAGTWWVWRRELPRLG